MCLRGRAEEWKQISPAVMHVINKLPYHSPIYAYKCVIIFLILPSYKCGHVAGCTSRCKDSMAYIYTPMELIWVSETKGKKNLLGSGNRFITHVFISSLTRACWQKSILNTEEFLFRMHEAMEINVLCLWDEPVIVFVSSVRQSSCSEAWDVHFCLSQYDNISNLWLLADLHPNQSWMFTKMYTKMYINCYYWHVTPGIPSGVLLIKHLWSYSRIRCRLTLNHSV